MRGFFIWYALCNSIDILTTIGKPNLNFMIDLQTVHTFVRDPLTDKLFHKYVTDRKAQRIFETSVRIVELAVVATPLIIMAVRGIRDIAKSRRRSGLRRLMPV